MPEEYRSAPVPACPRRTTVPPRESRLSHPGFRPMCVGSPRVSALLTDHVALPTRAYDPLVLLFASVGRAELKLRLHASRLPDHARLRFHTPFNFDAPMVKRTQHDRKTLLLKRTMQPGLQRLSSPQPNSRPHGVRQHIGAGMHERSRRHAVAAARRLHDNASVASPGLDLDSHEILSVVHTKPVLPAHIAPCMNPAPDVRSRLERQERVSPQRRTLRDGKRPSTFKANHFADAFEDHRKDRNRRGHLGGIGRNRSPSPTSERRSSPTKTAPAKGHLAKLPGAARATVA